MEEFIQSLSTGQIAAIILGLIGALLILVNKFIKIASAFVSDMLRTSRSNTDRHNSNDVHRATDSAQINHNTEDIKHIKTRVTNLENKD